MLTGIPVVAEDGTPADGGAASANVAQVIELTGTDFTTGTRVVFETRNNGGGVSTTTVTPSGVSEDGTRLQVIVPDLATTGDVRLAVGAQGGTSNLGFGGWNDSINRDIGVSFTATSSTAQILFADGGLQGLSDESWGIDNVSVALSSTPQSPLFLDDFESGADPRWTVSTTDNSVPGAFSRFSGRFSNGQQVLNLDGLTAGQQYDVEFDFYAIDSWDGNSTSNGPDVFNVFVDAVEVFSETFVHSGTNQSFGQLAGGVVPLQIVPVISVLSGRPGLDASFTLLGSGFMEGASTMTVGGVPFEDVFTNDRVDVSGSRNSSYVGISRFALEGPIRVETSGGYDEIAGPVFGAPSFVDLRGIETTASRGVPANSGAASANPGQSIVLTGRALTGSTLVQFEAVDDAGESGVLTRTGTPSADGTRLTVVVPAQARTGEVRVVGDSETSLALQIVPQLYSLGGTLASGASLVLEGRGLVSGELSVTIDGQAATGLAFTTVSDSGAGQQVVDATVPSGVGPGVIVASTAGGSFTLLSSETVSALADVTTTADVGDTLSTALAVNLPSNREVLIDPEIGDNAFGGRDVDVFRLDDLAAGDVLTIDVDRLNENLRYARLFNASGTQLAADVTSGGNSNARINNYTVPSSGTYYVGVSGWANTTYDPELENSGTNGGTGPYTLSIRRVDGGSTSLSGLSTSAGSGTARRAFAGSANPGQVITLAGVGLLSSDRVVFTTVNNAGALGSQAVSASSVAPDGTSLEVTVPAAATSGRVRLERERSGVFLQVVPTIADLDQGVSDVYHNGGLRMRGSGFAEGGTSVHFDGSQWSDDSVGSSLLNVFDSSGQNNFLDVQIPNGVPFGPISVSTLGGQSAPFGVRLDAITSVAGSGVPVDGSAASANTGQQITFTGIGFDTSTDVVFRLVNASGTEFERVVRPIGVEPDGTSMTVVVPTQALTGTVGVVGDLNGAGVPLQVVPVVTNADMRSVVSDGSSASVRLRGSGFVESHTSLYTFGSVPVVDTSTSGTGVNVFDSSGQNNFADVAVVPSSEFFGAVTVTTAGGTSAPFEVGYTDLQGVALTGTAADAGQASANPSQAVTVVGTGLSTSTDLVGRYVDNGGTVRTVLLNPASVNGDGTEATLTVPNYFNGAFDLNVVGASLSALLQVVPQVTSLDVTSATNWQLQGRGFVEGNDSVYAFAGGSATDTSTSGSPINVFNIGGNASDNDAVNLVPVRSGFGDLTVTTAGGTSQPFATNLLHPGLGGLHDMAYDPSTGEVIVTNGSQFHRVDPATGTVAASLAMPDGNTNNIGLQILPVAMTLGTTVVAAGNLLVTDGDASTDKVFAVDPSDGTILATLDLGVNVNPVAGAYHPGTGHLFIMDDNPNEIHEIDASDGMILNTFATPFDINWGGMAVDPVTGNLWIGSSQVSTVAELQPDGTVVRQVSLSSQSVAGEISGLAFDSGGNLLASSTRSVVYRLTLPSSSRSQSGDGAGGGGTDSTPEPVRPFGPAPRTIPRRNFFNDPSIFSVRSTSPLDAIMGPTVAADGGGEDAQVDLIV